MCAKPSKIFRAQQGPDQINQQTGGDDPAKNQIKHGSHGLAGWHVDNQCDENGETEDEGNDVTHRTPTFQGPVSARIGVKPRQGFWGAGVKAA
jgi:hypothetical protein